MPVEHDPEWPSPCEILPPDAAGMVRWRPVPMEPLATFEGVPLHPELREFYGSFWGRDGGGRHSGEVASVRVAWNAKELARITRLLAAQVAPPRADMRCRHRFRLVLRDGQLDRGGMAV